MTNDLNPYAGERQQPLQVVGALGNAEAQRAVAEVQARMIIARGNPRNPMKCMDDILTDCQRPTLAHLAIYQYARGGTDITGPSIRLAEAIARRWGNLATGIKEVARADGYSECIAYAWDLETGYYDERQFQVRHWRDTRQGGKALTDERDIYELIANMGQRRKRAVLLTILPGDVVEAAREQCERTLHATADTSPEALRKMVAAFREIGVSQAQIEKKIQRRMDAITPAQVIHLRKVFISIKDEMSKPEDWFEPTVWTNPEEVARRPTTPQPVTGTDLPDATTQTGVGGGLSATVDFTKDAALIRGDGAEIFTTEKPVEIWATDEFGEPVAEGHGFTPPEFAKWFATKLFVTKNPAALIEHNADALKDAREADPSAEAEIVDAIMRHDKRRREDEAAKTTRKPIKGPTTAPGYQDRARAEIETLKSDAEIEDWIRTNESTYKNRATEIPINAAIARRRAELSPPPISSEDIFPGDIPNEGDQA